MKKILYLTVDGLSDPLGQSQVLPYLLKLSELGHNITIVSLEKPEKYKISKDHLQRLTQSSGILWFPLEYKMGIPVLSQYSNVVKLRKMAMKLMRSSKYDWIHARSYLASLVAIKIKSKFQCRFLFDMRGFWADERVEGGIWKKSNFIHRLLYTYFKRKETELIENADAIVTLTHKAKNFIIENFNLRHDDLITVIPCATDLEFFDPKEISREDTEKLRLQLNISKNKLVVSYLGSVGTWYMLEEMIDFFKAVNQKTSAHFLVLSQDDKVSLQTIFSSFGISKSDFSILSLSRNEIPKYLLMSDLSVFFIRPTFSKIASCPTKMGELLAMGIPILTNRGVGDVDAILEEEHCGFLLDKLNQEGYSNVVEDLENSLQQMSPNCRTVSAKYFSLDEGVKKYHTIYNS